MFLRDMNGWTDYLCVVFTQCFLHTSEQLKDLRMVNYIIQIWPNVPYEICVRQQEAIIGEFYLLQPFAEQYFYKHQLSIYLCTVLTPVVRYDIGCHYFKG